MVEDIDVEAGAALESVLVGKDKKKFIFILLVLCSAVHAKFYEVRGRTKFLHAVKKAPMAVVCVYQDDKNNRNKKDVRNLFCMMQNASKNHCYRYINLPFIMFNVAQAPDSKDLLCISTLPAVVLFIKGAPLAHACLYPVDSSMQVTAYVDKYLGTEIDKIYAAKKNVQRELQMQAVKAWGFYAPYAYQPAWYNAYSYCSSGE